MARLVLLSEGLTGRTYELKAEKTTVGRLPDNTFSIPEASVSSHHAEILLRGSDVLIKDLNSTNGTFINGEKVSEAVVKPGQILRVGMVEMRLEAGEPAKAISKQILDQTRVIPQGVKLDEIEGTRTPLNLEKTGFGRKSNKATRIFIMLAIAVGIILVALLVYTVSKSVG